MDGHHVYIVHGWIADDQARALGRKRYDNSPNLFVHARHLTPLEPLCQLDEAYWAQRADRWYFDAAGELRARDLDGPDLRGLFDA